MPRELRVIRRVSNLKGQHPMNQPLKTLAEDIAIAAAAFAQSTVVPIDNEPMPRLIVESPLSGP